MQFYRTIGDKYAPTKKDKGINKEEFDKIFSQLSEYKIKSGGSAANTAVGQVVALALGRRCAHADLNAMAL